MRFCINPVTASTYRYLLVPFHRRNSILQIVHKKVDFLTRSPLMTHADLLSLHCHVIIQENKLASSLIKNCIRKHAEQCSIYKELVLPSVL